MLAFIINVQLLSYVSRWYLERGVSLYQEHTTLNMILRDKHHFNFCKCASVSSMHNTDRFGLTESGISKTADCSQDPEKVPLIYLFSQYKYVTCLMCFSSKFMATAPYCNVRHPRL